MVKLAESTGTTVQFAETVTETMTLLATGAFTELRICADISPESTVHIVSAALQVSPELSIRIDGDTPTSEHADPRSILDSEKFESIAASVPGYIFRYILTPDGDEHLDYISPGAIDVWEPAPGEDIADPKVQWERVLEEDRTKMRASVEDAFKGMTPWEFKYRIRVPRGEVKWLHGRGRPRLLPSGMVVFDGLIIDITKEAAIEQELTESRAQLAQAQKMEAIGRISGGIAHDFNNLLAIIRGNAELLESDPGAEGADGDDYIEEIKKACLRGSELTRRLLSFARKSNLVEQVVNANSIIAGMGSLVQRVIPENISVETVLYAGLWNTRVDPNYLENAILNVVVNARDAMPDGGALTIETSNLRVTEEYVQDRKEDVAPGRYVMVAITDTGCGIPPGEIEKVIEPFYSTKGPDLGTGLGLAMVHGFAKQSRGTMRIYSEVGVGTTIKLYLPITEDAVNTPSYLASSGNETSGLHSGHILVVEDEVAILKLLETSLRLAGFQLSMATSGEEALREYLDRAEEFDVLLTDVVMPGNCQGPQLAAQMTKANPDLQVVFMSGYPNEAAVHGNGLRATDRFLIKPVQRSNLLKVLNDAVETARRVGGDGEGNQA